MSKRIIEQILGASEGEIVSVSPDHILITNGPSHNVTEFITKAAAPQKVQVYIDHNVPSGTTDEAKTFGELLHMSRQFGFSFVQAKGVALQHLLNSVVKSGEVVITGSRHSALLGAKGALGIHVVSTELARVVENDKYSVQVPSTLGVKIIGALPQGASAMDAAMTFLAENPEIVGKAIEFVGGALSQQQKAILCSMVCRTGAYTAFAAEAGETEAVLNLSDVQPMVMMPCAELTAQQSAQCKLVSTIAGITFDAGQVGGITGGTIEDLRLISKLTEGKKLKHGFRLSICPATSQDYLLAMEEGIITHLIDFGAQISAAGDHSVVPQGAGAMGPCEKLITTGLYTFAGCMGCQDAEVYSASVQTVMEIATIKCV